MRLVRRLSVYSLRNPPSSQSQPLPHPSSKKFKQPTPYRQPSNPTLFFPRIPSIKIPTIPPPPSKNKKIPHCLPNQPHHEKAAFHSLLPSTHPPNPFSNSDPRSCPLSAFPTHFSPFASSLNPLYKPPPRITSSPPTTHRYPPPSTYCSAINNQTHHPCIPAPDHFNPALSPSPTIQASASVTLTFGIELPHFRVIKANKYQITGSVGRRE